jgi:hypothetical protein
VFGIARPPTGRDRADVGNLEHPPVRLGPDGRASLDPSTEVNRCAGRRLRRRGARSSRCRRVRSTVLAQLLVKPALRSRSKALVGSHARRYTVTAEGARPVRPLKRFLLRSLKCPCSSVRNRVPGVLKIQAYVPGKSSAPGVAKGLQALLQRNAAWREPKAHCGLQCCRPAPRRLSDGGRDRAARGDRAHLRARSCAHRVRRGSDDLLNLLARAYLQGRRRGDPHRRTAFWSIRSRRLGAGATPVVAPRKTTPPTSTRSSRG